MDESEFAMNMAILHLILASIGGGGVWSMSIKSMTGCDEMCGIAPEPNGGGGGSQTRRVSKCLGLVIDWESLDQVGQVSSTP